MFSKKNKKDKTHKKDKNVQDKTVEETKIVFSDKETQTEPVDKISENYGCCGICSNNKTKEAATGDMNIIHHVSSWVPCFFWDCKRRGDKNTEPIKPSLCVEKCSENTLGKSIKELKKMAANSEKHPHTAAALAKVPQTSSESVIEKEKKPDSETQKEEQKPRAHGPREHNPDCPCFGKNAWQIFFLRTPKTKKICKNNKKDKIDKKEKKVEDKTVDETNINVFSDKATQTESTNKKFGKCGCCGICSDNKTKQAAPGDVNIIQHVSSWVPCFLRNCKTRDDKNTEPIKPSLCVKKCSENTLGKSIKEFKKTAPNSEKHPHTAAALAKVPQASSESVIEKEEKPDSETQKEEQKPRAHDPREHNPDITPKTKKICKTCKRPL